MPRSHRTIWDRVWGYRERRLWRRTAQVGLVGALDEPQPAQRFVNGFNLRGWVASDRNTVVAAYLSGRKVWEGTTTKPRPDVAPNAKQFAVFVPAGSISNARLVTLAVTARHDGAAKTDAVTLHSFPLIRGGAGRSKLPRWAYGRVWNDDSTNADDAMNAVAGYDNRAEWQRSGLATADHLVSTVGITQADLVLEVGCGSGRVGTQLAPRCKHWAGADVSSNMLRFARAELTNAQNVSFVQLNSFDLSGVGDASQDVVYCTAVFMRLDEWDRYRYIEEFYRVLRPGGRVYFDNFDLRSPDGWALFLEMSALDVAVRPPNVSKASTEQELSWYAERDGFERIHTQTGTLWITVIAAKPTNRPLMPL